MKPFLRSLPWPAGWRTVYLRDLSRDGRLVQVTAWYPVHPAQAKSPLTFRTYVHASVSALDKAARGLDDDEKREAELVYAGGTFPGLAS